MQNLHKQHEQEMKATQMEIAQYDDNRGGNKGGRSGGGYEKTNKHGGSSNTFNSSGNQYVPKNDKGSKRQTDRQPSLSNWPVNIIGGYNTGKSTSSNGATSSSNSAANSSGKMNEESAFARAKEFWGYLDKQMKLGEEYTIPQAVVDFKKFREETTALLYVSAVIKTVYDCNKN